MTLTSGYDPFHNRTSLTDNLSRRGRTTFSYDAAFRLTTIAVKYGTSNGPQVVLGYDAANRETSIARTIGGSGTAVNTSFSYDNANRLTTITDQTGGGTHLATYVYGYDNANRVTTEVNAEGTVTYTYDSGGDAHGPRLAHRELQLRLRRQPDHDRLLHGHRQRTAQLARPHLHVRQ